MPTPLQHFYLYDDPDAEALDVDYLAGWLGERLPGVEVGARRDFLTHHLARFSEAERDALVGELTPRLEGLEVDNLVPPSDRDRLPPEYPASRGLDVVYEATGLQAVLRLLLPEAESRLSQVHVMFTSNYLGVWPEGATLLRLKVGVLGLPNVISTSGMVEALELPKQYHFMRQQLAVLGMDEELDSLSSQFEGRTVGYGDPRLNEICKGYLLQTLFYNRTGDVGCTEISCRLHLGASHEETLRTQTEGQPGLCPRHEELYKAWGGVPE